MKVSTHAQVAAEKCDDPHQQPGRTAGAAAQRGEGSGSLCVLRSLRVLGMIDQKSIDAPNFTNRDCRTEFGTNQLVALNAELYVRTGLAFRTL
jgi:hypothetical protein